MSRRVVSKEELARAVQTEEDKAVAAEQQRQVRAIHLNRLMGLDDRDPYAWLKMTADIERAIAVLEGREQDTDWAAYVEESEYAESIQH